MTRYSIPIPINKNFIRKILYHYLKYDPDSPFIFVSLILAFFAINISIVTMIISLGISNGLQKNLKKKLLSMSYPLTVASSEKGVSSKTVEKIRKNFPNLKLSPYYSTQVIVKNNYGSRASILYGVNFDNESAINNVLAKATNVSQLKSKFRMILGEGLSFEMNAPEGTKLTLIFSKQQAVGFKMIPLQKKFIIAGIFRAGVSFYDKAIIFTTLEAFHKILKRDINTYDGIHIYSEQPMEIIGQIRKILPDKTNIEGWWQENSNIYMAMKMEKKTFLLLLIFIIAIASFSIISSLLIIIMSRHSEIALLRTLGATKNEIRALFYYLGLVIGTAGIFSGVILGLIGIWVLQTFNIISLPQDVFGDTHLPIYLPWSDLSIIIISAIIIIFIAIIYPTKRATSISPLSILRNTT